MRLQAFFKALRVKALRVALVRERLRFGRDDLR
jgi:hypothetical protein